MVTCQSSYVTCTTSRLGPLRRILLKENKLAAKMLLQVALVLLGVILADAVPAFQDGLQTKHSHVVPTYFRRQNKDGSLINSQGPNFAEGISRPIIDEISASDLKSASLKVHPFVVENGATVTVSWSGISNPTEKDWIAILCPWNDKSELRLDHFFVSSSPTWKEGHGSQEVHVFNLRSQCEFRYFRNKGESRLVARSNVLGFEMGEKASLQGRIALTGDPSQMRVMWTAAKGNKLLCTWQKNQKM